MFKQTLLSLLLAATFNTAHASVDFDLDDLVPATSATEETQTVDTSDVKEVDE
ncbi:hypothetical protein JCM19237_5385 [Photobacterium aphoticum]|uniref:Uncharacterized protein n=1 Tax=Photobacterium aphoticum TaxID=754436 RepID=A0A090R4E3_9GAMM|nr:hypothetical protein JCM19237_5385 [Photobacterium aphoticum]